MSEGGLEIRIIGRKPLTFALADIGLFVIALTVLWFYVGVLSTTFYDIFPGLVVVYALIAALFAWSGSGLLASWGVLFAGALPYYWALCSTGLTPQPSQGFTFSLTLSGCPVNYHGNPVVVIAPLVGALLVTVIVGTLAYTVGNSLNEGVRFS